MRQRKKKTKQDHGPDTHRWVVSYADFITLLFAFFVVMYAISSVNISKYRTVAEGMHNAFHQPGQDHADARNKNPQNGQNAKKGNDLGDKDPFSSLQEALAQMQDGNYKVQSHDKWIELNMSAGALFDSGDAEIKARAIPKIMKLARILIESGYPIAIEGYTDDVPIHTAQYPSNWELSSARASSFARSLIGYGLSPTQLVVTGYGEQYPVADNYTEAGRSQNRRVTLIIARDKSVPRFLDPGIGAVNRNDPLILISVLPSIKEALKK